MLRLCLDLQAGRLSSHEAVRFYKILSNYFQQWFSSFAFPQARTESLCCSASLPVVVIVRFCAFPVLISVLGYVIIDLICDSLKTNEVEIFLYVCS